MLPAMEAVEAAKEQGLEASEHLDLELRRAFFRVGLVVDDQERVVRVVLGLVDLSAAANRRVKGYSLGMRQRLGIARIEALDRRIATCMRSIPDERRKLDETRSEAQKTAEAIEKNAASQALASGTRAARQLEEVDHRRSSQMRPSSRDIGARAAVSRRGTLDVVVRDQSGAGVTGEGLSVSERLPIEISPSPESQRYLKTKKEKLGHKLKTV